VNYGFTETLEDEEVAFVLAHEVLHCVLGHPDRRGERERLRWNVAVDYATNALLVETGFTPPASALYERRYAGLRAEEIYDVLPRSAHGIAALVASSARGKAGGGAAHPHVCASDTGETHPGATAGYDLHLEP